MGFFQLMFFCYIIFSYAMEFKGTQYYSYLSITNDGVTDAVIAKTDGGYSFAEGYVIGSKF